MNSYKTFKQIYVTIIENEAHFCVSQLQKFYNNVCKR